MGRDDILDWLEAEAVHILREVVAEVERPVMLFSGGKDSAVMLHLARKAFHPAPPPFPLLHIDTMWKFAQMYAFRDAAAAEAGLQLIVHRNPDAQAAGINPFDHGGAVHTDLWKTQGLKQALDAGRFDAAFGGARRDEEKSRAKERIVSVRTAAHSWDPRDQRPELWSLYNTRLTEGQTLRVFPLSNWTELDVWRYVQREGIALPALYLAADRPVITRDGALLLAEDARLRLCPGETPVLRRVRFRTLGCWPLTGAVESRADTLDAVVAEVAAASASERRDRAIDHDPAASMERKKREGYF
jgi:sulfate adenylyltransferase subunit 2